MYIATKLKVDQKQRPYWSAMLMHNNECLIEVHSQVFDPVNQYEYWNRYEMTQNIQRLALYMFDRSTKGRAEDWRTVLKVLQVLRDGFGAIREQAVELESQGQIPAPSEAAAVSVSV